jgi:hypothetical protein
MINWAKPILINGLHETFKLTGTLNGKQLVVTTAGPQAIQTLFLVDNDTGESIRMSPLNAYDPIRGPQFENESESIEIERFLNIYEDSHVGIHTTEDNARAGTGIAGNLRARVRLNIRVSGNGSVTGAIVNYTTQ